MAINPPTQRNLLANLRTRRTRQAQLRGIGLDAHDLGTRGRGADIDHQDLVLRQLGHLGLFAVGGFDAEEAAQQEIVDLEFGVDGREAALEAEHEADEPIGAAQGRVDAGADADEAAWDGEFEIVVFGEEGDDAAEDGPALDLAFVVFGHEAGPDFDLVAELEHSRDDAAACDAAFQVFDFGARFVDVEGADDDHVGCGGEVAWRDGYAGDEVLVDGVDVVF